VILHKISVVDIFAGPGGLAEGFSQARNVDGAFGFRIELSIEKEARAHSTLLLRSFLRQFDTPPDEYYEFLNDEGAEPDWAILYPDQWRRACDEAWQLELGTEDPSLRLNARLDQIRKEAGDGILLIGGPPCQAYSLVGRARNAGKQGYVASEDGRHFLYKEYIRILDRLRPAAFVMENVKGMLSSTIDGQARIIDRVLADLQGERPGAKRYRLVALTPRDGREQELIAKSLDPGDFVVRAEKLGIPQSRHRVIIVGSPVGVACAGGRVMGFEGRSQGSNGFVTPDGSQSAVIGREPSARLLVDAGPGTGKTAVACARIAHLISAADVNPARIWMISFTRTAVTEMRNRLVQHVGEHAYAIKIATVDAHAWAINAGYSQQATLTGSYDDSIERVLELISIDDDSADYIGQLENLMVDEAQDLVGVRAELMEVLIAGLSPSCGVTIFADDAQAIYGFSEEKKIGDATGTCRLSLTVRLAAGGGFERCQLGEIHRTGSRTLRAIFSEVRAAVLSIRETTGGLFEEIRNSVQSLADGSDLSATKLGISAIMSST
jgi:site-specific DNA-cytosine methylase